MHDANLKLLTTTSRNSKFVMLMPKFPRLTIMCMLQPSPAAWKGSFRVGVGWFLESSSRVAAKQRYLGFQRILLNDWYIFKPATSDAVIIHTHYK